MADNVQVFNGEFATYYVSADEAVGGHVQRFKLTYSADGSEAHVQADADGLLVNLGGNNDVVCSGTVALDAGSASIGTLGANSGVDIGDVTINNVAGAAVYVQPGTSAIFQVQSNSANLATETTAGLIKTAVEIIDDWDESDRAKVNPIVGQAGITAGAGAVAANTPRVTHASDDPAVTALQVIDDWDESDRCKVNLIVGNAGLDVGLGASSAGTIRVMLAEDDPAVVSLGELTGCTVGSRFEVNLIVGQEGITAGAGAVAANTPRVTHASDDPVTTAVQVMDDWDESDRAKVNPIVGQAGIAAGAGTVGVTVPRVTLASDDPAVVALQIVDDWDESDRAKVNPIVGQAGIAAGAGTVGVTVPRVTLASDDPGVAALAAIKTAVEGELTVKDLSILLQLLLDAVYHPGYLDRTVNSIRVNLTATPAVSQSGNWDVRNVTGTIDGRYGRELVDAEERTAWHQCVRSRF